MPSFDLAAGAARLAHRCLPLMAAGLLAACTQTMPSGPSTTLDEGPAGAIGSGSVKVALLVPLTGDSASSTGTAMRNAAEMAHGDIPGSGLQILPFDTRGTAEGATLAARQAVSADVELIIGPVFSGTVRAAAAVAQPAGIPMIAFSSDANAAASGVYLLSFLPEGDVDRIVGHAIGEGRRSFAALLPQSAYGSVVEGAFQQSVAGKGGRILALERYGQDQAQLRAAIGRIAAIAGGDAPQVGALFLPDGPEAMRVLAPMLAEAGISPARVRLLGSGLWNDSAAWAIPQLAGGRFAAPDPAGWQRFASRYEGRYGAEPPRNATLAYDAVSLAAALARAGGENVYDQQVLTNPDGFAGLDGVFRFRADGTNQRGLAVLEIENGAAVVREPAPRAFGSGT